MRRAILALAALAAAGCADDGQPFSDTGARDSRADGIGAQAPPSIDGKFTDWAAIGKLASDPTGDATGGFDLTMVKATSRGTLLYLYFAVGKVLNAHAGPTAEGTLRLELALPAGRHLTLDLRDRKAYADNDASQALRWSAIGYRIAPTHAGREFEIRIDLKSLGVKVGDAISINFDGSDRLAGPAQLSLTGPTVTPDRRSPSRGAGTVIRVASLNTWLDGLVDPSRSASLGRLVKAVAADIYCFQEVLGASSSTIADTLRTIDPHGDGAAWNAQQHGDLIIASRASLRALPDASSQQTFTAAALEISGTKLVVFTLRPVCCGYVGSAEDQSRIAEAKQLAATIKLLRGGQLGSELDPWRQAPLVVVGDWNLVGSRTPVDVLADPTGSALTHWQLRHLLGDDTFTWRNDNDTGRFPPGMLDLLLHSPALGARSGFVLDSGDLDGTTASKLGLLAKDSQASDHLLLVADFE